MKLIVSQWIIPENSLLSTSKKKWKQHRSDETLDGYSLIQRKLVHCFFSYSVAINGECQGENEEMPVLGEPIPMVKCSPKSFVFVCYCWTLLHIYIYNLTQTYSKMCFYLLILISVDIIKSNNHCFCSWFVVANVVQILSLLWFPFPISEVVLVINSGNAVKTAIISHGLYRRFP